MKVYVCNKCKDTGVVGWLKKPCPVCGGKTEEYRKKRHPMPRVPTPPPPPSKECDNG